MDLPICTFFKTKYKYVKEFYSYIYWFWCFLNTSKKLSLKSNIEIEVIKVVRSGSKGMYFQVKHDALDWTLELFFGDNRVKLLELTLLASHCVLTYNIALLCHFVFGVIKQIGEFFFHLFSFFFQHFQSTLQVGLEEGIEVFKQDAQGTALLICHGLVLSFIGVLLFLFFKFGNGVFFFFEVVFNISHPKAVHFFNDKILIAFVVLQKRTDILG